MHSNYLQHQGLSEDFMFTVTGENGQAHAIFTHKETGKTFSNLREVLGFYKQYRLQKTARKKNIQGKPVSIKKGDKVSSNQVGDSSIRKRGDNSMEKNELQHYGVVGMKWGVRKNPERAYERAGKKLSRLDSKVNRINASASQYEQKALEKQSRASNAILFKRHKAKVAANKTRKAMGMYQKAQTKQLKAYQWNEQMQKVFKNTKIKNANPEYVKLGKKYAKLSLDDIMRNNTSINAMMNINDYYQKRSR